MENSYEINSHLWYSPFYVSIQVEKCYAISASSYLVACACNNGVVKLFASRSLEYAGGLETKRCKESSSIDCEAESGQVEFQTLPAFPDAIACQFSTSEKLGKLLRFFIVENFQCSLLSNIFTLQWWFIMTIAFTYGILMMCTRYLRYFYFSQSYLQYLFINNFEFWSLKTQSWTYCSNGILSYPGYQVLCARLT